MGRVMGGWPREDTTARTGATKRSFCRCEQWRFFDEYTYLELNDQGGSWCCSCALSLFRGVVPNTSRRSRCLSTPPSELDAPCTWCLHTWVWPAVCHQWCGVLCCAWHALWARWAAVSDWLRFRIQRTSGVWCSRTQWIAFPWRHLRRLHLAYVFVVRAVSRYLLLLSAGL